MDEILSGYTYDELVRELERGHYWYYNGSFCSDEERDAILMENPDEDLSDRFISVENAVYFREVNQIDDE